MLGLLIYSMTIVASVADCGAGYYKSTSGCELCPTGYQSRQGDSECTEIDVCGKQIGYLPQQLHKCVNSECIPNGTTYSCGKCTSEDIWNNYIYDEQEGDIVHPVQAYTYEHKYVDDCDVGMSQQMCEMAVQSIYGEIIEVIDDQYSPKGCFYRSKWLYNKHADAVSSGQNNICAKELSNSFACEAECDKFEWCDAVAHRSLCYMNDTRAEYTTSELSDGFYYTKPLIEYQNVSCTGLIPALKKNNETECRVRCNQLDSCVGVKFGKIDIPCANSVGGTNADSHPNYMFCQELYAKLTTDCTTGDCVGTSWVPGFVTDDLVIYAIREGTSHWNNYVKMVGVHSNGTQESRWKYVENGYKRVPTESTHPQDLKFDISLWNEGTAASYSLTENLCHGYSSCTGGTGMTTTSRKLAKQAFKSFDDSDWSGDYCENHKDCVGNTVWDGTQCVACDKYAFGNAECSVGSACDAEPCHGGTCYGINECSCPEGQTGSMCQINIAEEDKQACQGTYIPVDDKCECNSNHYGEFCEYDIHCEEGMSITVDGCVKNCETEVTETCACNYETVKSGYCIDNQHYEACVTGATNCYDGSQICDFYTSTCVDYFWSGCIHEDYEEYDASITGIPTINTCRTLGEDTVSFNMDEPCSSNDDCEYGCIIDFGFCGKVKCGDDREWWNGTDCIEYSPCDPGTGSIPTGYSDSSCTETCTNWTNHHVCQTYKDTSRCTYWVRGSSSHDHACYNKLPCVKDNFEIFYQVEDECVECVDGYTVLDEETNGETCTPFSECDYTTEYRSRNNNSDITCKPKTICTGGSVSTTSTYEDDICVEDGVPTCTQDAKDHPLVNFHGREQLIGKGYVNKENSVIVLENCPNGTEFQYANSTASLHLGPIESPGTFIYSKFVNIENVTVAGNFPDCYAEAHVCLDEFVSHPYGCLHGLRDSLQISIDFEGTSYDIDTELCIRDDTISLGFNGTKLDEVDGCELCDHGTCHDNIFFCDCYDGAEGLYCRDINECINVNCGYGAECINGNQTYTCQCLNGTIQDYSCDYDCDQCQHCESCTIDGPTCKPGWSGSYCEVCSGGAGDNCTLCEAGTFLSENQCQDCEVGKTSLAGATNVTDCFEEICLGIGDTSSCECYPGWEGRLCNIDTNFCKEDPCERGDCLDDNSTYICSCPAGYNGTNCSVNIDECASNPCQHGGNCTDMVNSYKCSCPAGYSGTNCNNNINECDPNPCEHGTCNDLVNDYNCTCPLGYEGKNCSVNIDDCQELPPCQNGAICEDKINGRKCHCLAGFSGPDCGVNDNDCATEPCQNGGNCTDKVNDYECTCPTGYGGNDCDIDIDDCLPTNICVSNGTTSPPYYKFYWGPDYIEEVTSLVANTTYTFSRCGEATSHPFAINVNGWQPSEVVNQELKGTDTLQVTTGTEDLEWNCTNHDMSGIFTIDNTVQGCHNGGTCYDELNDYRCSCLPGFSGDHCQINIDDCQNHECQNDAGCKDMVNEYSCTCQPGYSGDRCQNSHCDAHECANDASCTPKASGYTCTCEPGWRGDKCNIPACQPDTCGLHGDCGETASGIRCGCVNGFQRVGDECLCGLGKGYNGSHCLDCVDRTYNLLYTHNESCRTQTCDDGIYTDIWDYTSDNNCEPCADGYKPNVEHTECVRIQCEDLTNPCNEINNHGECTNTDEGYECDCNEGYTGASCEPIDGSILCDPGDRLVGKACVTCPRGKTSDGGLVTKCSVDFNKLLDRGSDTKETRLEDLRGGYEKGSEQSRQHTVELLRDAMREKFDTGVTGTMKNFVKNNRFELEVDDLSPTSRGRLKRTVNKVYRSMGPRNKDTSPNCVGGDCCHIDMNEQNADELQKISPDPEEGSWVVLCEGDTPRCMQTKANGAEMRKWETSDFGSPTIESASYKCGESVVGIGSAEVLCNANTCVYGECIVSGDSWECKCDHGYVGNLCDTPLSDFCAAITSPVDYINYQCCSC